MTFHSRIEFLPLSLLFTYPFIFLYLHIFMCCMVIHSFMTDMDDSLLGSFNGLELAGPESTIRKWKRENVFPGLHREPRKCLTQGLYHSRRNRALSRGGLGSPRRRVSMMGFYAPDNYPEREKERMKERQTDRPGDPSSDGANVLQWSFYEYI